MKQQSQEADRPAGLLAALVRTLWADALPWRLLFCSCASLVPQVGCICNNSRIDVRGSEAHVTGQPTEAALLVAAVKVRTGP